MTAADTGARRPEVDPAIETCPFCAFEGARIAVYRHIESGHSGIDPADIFSDPVGDLA